MAKKQNAIIDESFMREIISQGLPISHDEPKNESNRSIKTVKPSLPTHKAVSISTTKSEETDYKEIFFQKIELPDRRSVYVSQDTHTKITQIVSVIGKGKITVSGFVESIIQHHLVQYKDDINELYKSNKDILL